MSSRRQIWFLVICLALFAARALLYATLLPPNTMPDELVHFKHIRQAQYSERIMAGEMDAGRLMRSIQADYLHVLHRRDRRSDPATVKAALPPARPNLAYYPLMGGLLRHLGVEDNLSAWYACRLVSILTGLIVIGCTWLMLRLVLPGQPLAAAAGAAFLALVPQWAAMCAVISTDKPAEVAGALFFLFIVCLIRPVRSVAWLTRSWAWLGATLIILSLPWVKRTAFYFVLVAVLAALPWWRAWLSTRPGRGRIIVAGLTMTAVIAFLAAVFVPPVGRLAASLLGMPLLRIYSPIHEAAIFQQQGMLNVIIQAVRPWDPTFWHLLYLNLVSLFKSSWATFGYLDLHLKPVWYLGAMLMTLTAALGWLRLLYRPGRNWRLEPWQGRTLGLLAAGAVLAVGVVLFRQMAFLPGALSQGRYAFPGLAALTAMGAVGFVALWPRRWRIPALTAALVWITAMDMAAVWRTIVPHYYWFQF